MKQLLVIFLTSLVYLVICKEPNQDITARYRCPDKTNSSRTIMTIDINAIKVKFPNINETQTYNFLNSSEFIYSTNQCEEYKLPKNNSKVQTFLLRFHDHTQMLKIEFIGNTTAYHVEKLIYTKITEDNFYTRHEYEIVKPNLHIGHKNHEFKTEIQGYKCSKVSYELTEKGSNNTVELELNDFMFFAFQNNVDTTDMVHLECLEKPSSSLIPIIVGGSLLVLAGVVVAIYFVMRKKPSSDAE